MRPTILECVCISNTVLLICKLLYSAGSRMTVKVVLAELSMVLFYLVQVWMCSYGYVCVFLLCCLCVAVCYSMMSSAYVSYPSRSDLVFVV